jgi:hypothetical protein
MTAARRRRGASDAVLLQEAGSTPRRRAERLSALSGVFVAKRRCGAWRLAAYPEGAAASRSLLRAARFPAALA